MSAPAPRPPAELETLARERAEARRARRWEEADALRSRIEAAGWKPVDDGLRWTLVPIRPPDVVDAERTRYGTPDGVPSRLEEPDAADLTILVILGADDVAATPDVSVATGPEALLRLARDPRPRVDRSQLLAVIVGPGRELVDAVEGGPADVEIVVSSARLSPGALLEMGVRRAIGRVIAWVDPAALRGVRDEAIARAVERCVAALDDPHVAVAGTSGLIARDVLHLVPALPGDVAALGAGILCFRRADARERGPQDERFHLPDGLAAWWSLVLRDEGDDLAPRRALAFALEDSPATPAGAAPTDLGSPAGTAPTDRGSPTASAGPAAERLRRRDRYRLRDGFGHRPDLLDLPAATSD